jgi:integrase
MGFIEKRNGRYRARYRDPLGRQRCETFTRKTDAERFVREIQVDIERGRWIDPRGADRRWRNGPRSSSPWPAACRRARRRPTSATSTSTSSRASAPTGSAGCQPTRSRTGLNDEVAAGVAPSSVLRHYRTLRRMLQVAVEKQKLLANPCDRVQPPRVPKREMTFLSWGQVVDLAEAHGERYRALVYLAVDSGMRWSELVGLRRARVDLRNRKVRVTEQQIRLETGEWYRKEPKTSTGVRSITISPVTAELLARTWRSSPRPARTGSCSQIERAIR